MKQATFWVINYLDQSGQRGIAVDLKTLKDFHVDTQSILTTISKYNESEVSIELKQPRPIPQFIKLGWINHKKLFNQIENFLSHYSSKLILDGLSLSYVDKIRSVAHYDLVDNFKRLFPGTYLFICNLQELEKITGIIINTYLDITKAVQCLIKWGVKNILIKGGQLKIGQFCQDYFCNQEESFWIVTQRLIQKKIDTKDIFSTAIMACLACDHSLNDALIIARMYIQSGLRNAYTEAQIEKFFHHQWPNKQIDLPYLCKNPLLKFPETFNTYQTGFYPIVDSSQWVEKLLSAQVKTIQLRIKKTNPLLIAKEIQRSVLIAKKYQANLFVNDYWKLAIQYGAYGVHLGQEDLETADINEIYQSGLYLGLSTHCYYEVACAHALSPSYIACGPIYPTQSKIMSFQAQGIMQLNYWRRMLDYPLVAIGGITLERLKDVLQSGVNGVAVISAITQAKDPYAMSQKFLLSIQNNDSV